MKKEDKKKHINIDLSFDEDIAKNKKKSNSQKIICRTDKGCGGFLYGTGFLGALVYYISTATGFWAGVLGILKACFWPAFLVYELLKFLGA